MAEKLAVAMAGMKVNEWVGMKVFGLVVYWAVLMAADLVVELVASTVDGMVGEMVDELVVWMVGCWAVVTVVDLVDVMAEYFKESVLKK